MRVGLLTRESGGLSVVAGPVPWPPVGEGGFGGLGAASYAVALSDAAVLARALLLTAGDRQRPALAAFFMGVSHSGARLIPGTGLVRSGFGIGSGGRRRTGRDRLSAALFMGVSYAGVRPRVAGALAGSCGQPPIQAKSSVPGKRRLGPVSGSGRREPALPRGADAVIEKGRWLRRGSAGGGFVGGGT